VTGIEAPAHPDATGDRDLLGLGGGGGRYGSQDGGLGGGDGQQWPFPTSQRRRGGRWARDRVLAVPLRAPFVNVRGGNVRRGRK
jgi:hypothetical protein